MSKYYQVTDGQWMEVPKHNFHMQCCDCGLVHVMNFKTSKGKVYVQAYRDNRSTGQVRRHRGIKLENQ